MAASHYRHRRTSTAATPFPTPVEPGEIVVNTANRQLVVGDAASASLGQPLPLLAVRIFDPRAQYAAGEFVISGSNLYRAKAAVIPAAFNAAQWDLYSSDVDSPTGVTQAYVDAGDAAVTTAFQNADASLAASTQAGFDAQTTAMAAKVAKGGDTMTGHLSLPTGPAAANAVRKDYVDTAIGAVPAPPAAATAAPIMDSAAAVGTATKYAREDHVHPTDTSRAAASALPVAATSAEYLANSAPTKMLISGAVWGAVGTTVALADAATVTPDFSLGIDFIWTLAGARTLANPINPKVGQKGVIVLVQDGSGGRTIASWGSNWKFPGGVKPVLSSAPGSIDIISYFYSGYVYCAFSAGYA